MWLASGLLLSLLLVSGISVGSQLSLTNNFFPTQEFQIAKEASSQTWGRLNKSLDGQIKSLNNSATVISLGGVISSLFEPLISWFRSLWSKLFNKTPVITPAMREQIKQELLVELKNQGRLASDLMATSSDSLGARYGFMVVPSTGSTTRDELLKKSLKQMFADQVNVQFDQTGGSGVVTPVFQDGRKGGNYIFVLTPLR